MLERASHETQVGQILEDFTKTLKVTVIGTCGALFLARRTYNLLAYINAALQTGYLSGHPHKCDL